MVWQALFIYTVVAELVFFYWIWSSFISCEGVATVYDTSKLTSFQKFRFYLVMNLMMMIAAPFALPVMAFYLVKGYRQARIEHEEKYGHHIEMLLEPLHPSNMPEELGAYIEEHLPAAVGMKFDALGDYWLKEEPHNSKARILLSEDQRCFAEIGVTDEVHYCELISFLEDGTMVGTGNAEPFCDPYSREKNGYYINLIGEADMLQTIDSHLAFLEEVCQRSGKAVRTISRENWKEYYHYHNQKYGLVRFERGEAKTPPERCEFPAEPQFNAEREADLVG